MDKKTIIITSVALIVGITLGVFATYQQEQSYILESRDVFSREYVKQRIFDDCFNFYAETFREEGISQKSIALCWAKTEDWIVEVEKTKEDNYSE
tara:strand:+ start:340 stop:624 length:285 start_codon:yes stop_codon:yes gene_type:complete